MGGKKCEIRIGTSGWHYDHWVGPFYPEDLPRSRRLQYYAESFDTVEINNTFYQLPKETTLQKWYDQSPRGFVYTLKANRYITHIKRLKSCKDELRRFLDAACVLKEKLGPILYQLPPSLHKDVGLLEDFIGLLPKDRPGVFEFRHGSWFGEDVYELLRRFNMAFCIHDLGGEQSPRMVTAETVYIRFHGTTGRYAGRYSDAVLRQWAQWLKENCREAPYMYAYFNNDAKGHAVSNARTLRDMLIE